MKTTWILAALASPAFGAPAVKPNILCTRATRPRRLLQPRPGPRCDVSVPHSPLARRTDMVGDDYGHSDLAYHGGDIPTPNMDKWSALGVRLESFYTQPSTQQHAAGPELCLPHAGRSDSSPICN